jgi:hypothetical protein
MPSACSTERLNVLEVAEAAGKRNVSNVRKLERA